MLDFVEILNQHYEKTRHKRIKQEFREVLGKDVDQLSGPQKYIYEIYIEPNMAVLTDSLYQAFREAGRPLDEWRRAVLENPPSIINHAVKKMIVRAIRESEFGQA